MSRDDWGAERWEERSEAGVPRFRRSEVASFDHFEKRKLGRIVTRLSLVDRLEILEERDDDDDEDMETKDIDTQGSIGDSSPVLLTKKVCP